MSSFRTHAGRAVRALVVLMFTVSATLAAVAQPAQAALPAPSGLTSTDQLIPVLSWDHVQDSTQYVVELSRTADSSGLIGSSVTTANRNYVPTQPLPWSSSTLTLYWRVAARDTAVGEFSAWTALTRSAAYDAPVVTSPTSGQTFTQPANPATLTWEPMAGAQEYDVQISQDSSFTDDSQITTAKTVSTTYVVPRPQVATTFWFRIRARLSTSAASGSVVFTDYSAPRSYSVSALPAAQRVEPATDATVIDDAFLDWNPIPGAKTYDVQISTAPDFGSIVHTSTNITGTSYARPASLNNDTYYWRVRAEDIAGNVQSWETRPTWRFTREWPDLPMPVYPANPADINPATPNDTDTGVSVGDPFYYEWEPVKFASMYRIDVSTTPDFSPNPAVTKTCYTRNTTYTPRYSDACQPGSEGTYWWRVSAMDQHRSNNWIPQTFPLTSQNVFHDARFTYQPDRVSLLSPAPGASVTVPTLRWNPLAGAARYEVRISSPLLSLTERTAATSFTATEPLPAGNYTWEIIPIAQDGRLGSSLLSGQRPFTLAPQPTATASSPEVVAPLSGTFARFPSLSWTRVVNADRYRVLVRTAGGSGWDVVDPEFFYAEGTDPSSQHLAPGAYEWRVQANVGGGWVDGLSMGQFDISSPAAVTGQINALTMTGATSGDTCTGFECTDLRQTPVMKWDPAPGTGYYQLWIARNANLSNMVPPAELGLTTNPFSVTNTTWIPTTTLQESTAGEAYYWAVQPCTYDGRCAANPVPLNSFNKASNAVESVSPGVVAIGGVPQGVVPVVSDDVTLSWRDYLLTNREAAQGSSQLSTTSRQAGREYEVQIATDHTFQQLLDSEYVDQRRYTTFDTTYPEGNVYWRVRAIDSFGNPLPWSATRTFNKQSPTPQLTAPAAPLSSTPTLSWSPLNFAAAYQLEIYPKGSNTVRLTTTSEQVKWSPTAAAQSLAPGNYEWRVRRTDARSRFGGWSGRTEFTVGSGSLSMVAPDAGATVDPRDSVFTWNPVAGASDYRVTLTSPTGGTTIQVTKATSYAPIAKLATGAWTWTVESRDSNGVANGTSGSRAFTVGGDLGATQAARIDGSGQVDTVLTGHPPVWNRTPDSVEYQWLRGSTPVGDGTLSYTIVVADVGQRITLRATASKAGFPDAVSTSNAINGVKGAAPTAQTPPTITGTGLVGETLTGNLPTWVESGVTTTSRWLVNGSSVGTAPTFTLRAGDLGKQVVFEVTGKRTNYADAIVTSAPLTVQAGGALQPTTQPSISGTPAPGNRLSLVNGAWSQPSPTFSYQWLRTGAPIPKATGSSYGLTPEDAGKNISVVVLATKAGFTDGSATAPSVAVAKLTSTTTFTMSTLRVKRTKKGKVKVGLVVTVPGVEAPSGVIRIMDGVKTLKTLTMDPFRKGVMKTTLKLAKLKPGRHKIKVVYVGNAYTDGSKSKVQRLIVTR